MVVRDRVNVLGICGSLRAASLNAALLRAAADLSPAGVTVHLYEGLADVPPYNGDLDGQQPPGSVADLRERIRRADALLVSTPEYNYSIPGVLKNALDWASRPVASSVLRAKPVASIGAAPGNFGTVRAQLALRQVWLSTGSIPVTRPELHVFRAKERFDGDGTLTDPGTRQLLTELLEALRDLALVTGAAAARPPAAPVRLAPKAQTHEPVRHLKGLS